MWKFQWKRKKWPNFNYLRPPKGQVERPETMASGTGLVMEASMPSDLPILDEEECLKDRKWWCFLLSSVFTFLMGVASVVVVRTITRWCCRRDDEDEFTQAELRKQEEEAKKLRLAGQNPEGGPEGDFMSEAKDWAGELISGQTGTGRILVCVYGNIYCWLLSRDFLYLKLIHWYSLHCSFISAENWICIKV